MKCTKPFSLLVVGAGIAGVGLIAVSVVVGSEFLRRLGLFPLLFAMFLLPHVLVEWEAARAVHLGNQPTDDVVHLGPSAAAVDATTIVQP